MGMGTIVIIVSPLCSAHRYWVQGVISPPIPTIGGNLEDELFFLPPVIIWNPLITYPLIVKSHLVSCMTCKEKITSTSWNDGSSPTRQPRTLHSIKDTVLLVSAVYSCQKGHELLAHDECVLKLFPSQIMIPFILLHKTGFTKDFVENIFAFCRRGVNFCEMESIVLERRLDHHSQRMYLLQLHYEACKKESMNELSTRSEMFRNELSSPSNNVISKCFLMSFLEAEEHYLSNIHALEVSEAISFDHTFKVATNIGHLRKDGVWVPQYDSLFLVLASNGHVLTWQLTKGTSLGQVYQLLQDLHDRATSQKRKIKYVYVDDCCKLRKAIQNIFGGEVVVRLDLFHAVQRITRTLPKKHPLFHKCVADFRLVFRADGDVGKQRLLPTPAGDVLLSKLTSFVEKWKNFPGNQILTALSMQAFCNIEKHIKSGCLSDIPPGMGTNRNERFTGN